MDPEGSGGGFEEMLRAIARQVGDSVDRAIEGADVDHLADFIGVDREQARGWIESAGSWLRGQSESFADDLAGARGREAEARRPHGDRPASPGREPHGSDPLHQAEPHPLDLPTEEQGAALAALDSGRWTIEPGSSALSPRGEGPSPSNAIDLTRELRARDWIAWDGKLTVTGRHALERWLGATAER
jgi:hypothetical protein